jgi:hypothetical protein
MFYCAAVEWDWGDLTESEESNECEPYEAGVSDVQRRFSAEAHLPDRRPLPGDAAVAPQPQGHREHQHDGHRTPGRPRRDRARSTTVSQRLWTPTPSRIERAHLTAFRRAAGADAGRAFDDYPALHAWSVGDPEAFWQNAAAAERACRTKAGRRGRAAPSRCRRRAGSRG